MYFVYQIGLILAFNKIENIIKIIFKPKIILSVLLQFL